MLKKKQKQSDSTAKATVDLSLNFRSKMASSRIGNASPSEFRLVLTKLTEVQKKLDETDQSSVIAQLRQVNDSLQILE